MAYVQREDVPYNKVHSLSLNNFAGGLNNNSQNLDPNQATSLMNMRFVDESLMENRYGQKYYDDIEYNSPIVFIDEFKTYVDGDIMIRATEDHLLLSGTSSLVDINAKPCGVTHFGKYYIADGDKFWVYGKFPQVTTTYEKVIGDPISEYVLLELKSPEYNHPRLSTEHIKGVLNIDYENRTIYYEPCELEFTDPFSGANAVPTDIKYLLSHNGRLFASGDNKDNDNVFISDTHNPFYFPVSLPIQLPPNSDMVRGMIVYDNAVIIGRKNDIYAILGNTNNPELGFGVFELQKLNTHTGFINNNCMNIVHNYLFFFGSDGNAYSLSSAQNSVKILSTSLIMKDIDLWSEPLNLSKTSIIKACSAFVDDEWYLNISDKTLVYSYTHKAWTVYNGLEAQCFYIIDGELIWGKLNGRVATFDKTVFLDFGKPYKSHWYSKYFDLNERIADKFFRDFFFIAYVYGAHRSDVTIQFEIDYGGLDRRIVISNQLSRWGFAKWGDRFLTQSIAKSEIIRLGLRGHTIRFKLTCGYNEDGIVSDASELPVLSVKDIGSLMYVADESCYYAYLLRSETGLAEWFLMTDEDLNQRMKVYEISGEYELRGKR